MHRNLTTKVFMGLTYHYRFTAPASASSARLEKFLKCVETDARRLGFSPTMVLNAEFDSPERQDFARRLTSGQFIENKELQGVVVFRDGQVWDHDSAHGNCRVIPERAVVLVITDEQHCETILGFFQYPKTLKDLNGRDVIDIAAASTWIFEDFVKTPDARLRQLVKKFAEAGYVELEEDEFADARK